jgi:hypothetical protein
VSCSYTCFILVLVSVAAVVVAVLIVAADLNLHFGFD